MPTTTAERGNALPELESIVRYEMAGGVDLSTIPPINVWNRYGEDEYDPYGWDRQRHVEALAQAFPFFRRHADGRYSSQTLMRLARVHDQAIERRIEDRALPLIAVAQEPVTYDEMTEQKLGGIVAMAVMFHELDGRTILAVRQTHRRRGIGTLLLRLIRQNKLPHLWVARGNTAGQHFLIANSMFPTQLGTTGTIRYAAPIDQEVEDDGSSSW